MKIGKDSNKEKSFFYVIFDLANNELEKFYPNKNINQSWYDIERFLKKSDFAHIQKSGYVSNDKISGYHMNSILNKMFEKMPWLLLCAKRIDVVTSTQKRNIVDIFSQLPKFSKKINEILKDPPVLDREDFSLSKKQNSPKPAIPPTPTKLDTVTLPLEELKEIFEAGVDMNVTVKKEELEKAKKQVEDKKQQSTAPKKTTAPSEQKKINKPKR